MDWKIFLTTFSAIFFAELADKTQIVGIGMSSKTKNLFSVWFGAMCAFMIVTAISVLIGSIIGKYIKPEIIKYIGSVLFVIIGILMFFDKI